MPLDPRIGLAGRVPELMSPAQGLSLQQFAGQVQDEQRIRQNGIALQNLFKQQGAIDQQTGVATPETVQRAYAIDPQVGSGLARERHLTLQELARQQQAQAAMVYKKAQADKWQADADRSRSKAETEKLLLQLKYGNLVREAALAKYDAMEGSEEEREKAYRQTWIDETKKYQRAGVLHDAALSDQQIEEGMNNIPPPKEARLRGETAREHEIRLKASLADPIAQTRLQQGQQKLDLQGQALGLKSEMETRKADRGDRALEIKQGDLERKIESDERKAGIAEDVIAARNEHDKAFIKLREAEDAVKAAEKSRSQDEIERAHKALEEARKTESEARGKAYGARAEKTSLLKMPKETESKIAQANRELEQGKITQEQHDATVANLMNARGGGTVKMSAKEAKFIKENESKLAQMNRELEEGKITQEQHDAAIAKLTDIPANRVSMILKGEKLLTGPGGTAEFGPTKDMIARGLTWNADPEHVGEMTYIKGGRMDPEVIERNAAAAARGRAAGGGGTRKEGTTVAGSPTPAGVSLEYVGKHGKEFLESAGLKPEYEAKVKAVGDGNVTMKTMLSTLPKGQRDRFMSDVEMYKPDFKEKSISKLEEDSLLRYKDARLLAMQKLAGDRQAFTGWARNAKAHGLLIKAMSDILDERGVPESQKGKILAQQAIEFQSAMSAAQRVGQRAGMVSLGIETASELKPLVVEASAALKRSNIKAWNDLYQKWQAGTASPELRELAAAINGFKNTYLRTIGGGQIHVEDEKKFDQILDKGFADGDVNAALNMLEKELQAEKRAVPRSVKSIKETLTTPGEKPTREKPDSPVITEGTIIRNKAGQRKILKGGQWLDLQ